MRLLCFFIAFCWFSTVAAADFQIERKKVEADPDKATNQLSALAAPTAEQWLLLSHGYMKLHNKDGALSAVDKALDLGLTPTLQIDALQHKALVYGIMFRDSKTAISVLQQAEKALQNYHEDDKPALQASIYESFAQGYNQRGDITAALKYAELSVAIATEYKLPKAELQSRLIAGRLALQQNNFSMAQQHLSRALELAQQSDDQASLGSIHLRLGMAYDKLELHQLAADHLRQAEQFLQMPERRTQLVTVLLTQMDVLLSAGDLTRAEVAQQKARDLLQQLKDPYLTAQLSFSEAQLSLARQQPETAEQQLLKAAQLFQQLGNRSMQHETSIALTEVALQQQQLEKARAYLPADLQVDTLPVFLQRKYWDVLSQIHANSGQWQAAYQAALSAYQARFELEAAQQQQRLDQLAKGLKQQQQMASLSAQNTLQRYWLWSLLTALITSWLGVLFYAIRRRSKPKTVPAGQVWVKSWTAFSRQLRKDQLRDPAVCLVAVQLQQISEFKLLAGEQLLRKSMRTLLEQLTCAQLLDSTIHTDVLWLSVSQPDAAWQQRLWQGLAAVQQQLPGQPAFRIWQGQLTALLGNDWQDTDINGLRELVWYSWQQQQANAGEILHFELSTSQQVPCSWQAENLRQDISNALALGLLNLRCQPLEHRSV
ncbi:MAG: hypothetical protein U5L02_05675 [Rheinheimera sp.]|nr:hypothetical protein [Rheinheimera sp.]